MNQVILMGRIASKLKKTVSKKNLSILRFDLSTCRKTEDIPKYDYHKLVAFGDMADQIYEVASQTELVGVKGRLLTQAYLKNGIKTYKTEVILTKIEFFSAIGSKKTKLEGGEATFSK